MSYDCSVTEDIGRTLASVLEPGSMTEIQLANVSMLVLKQGAGQLHQLAGGVASWEAGPGVRVELPLEPGKPATLSLANYNNLGGMMSDRGRGDFIRSSVLSVSLLDTDTAAARTELRRPVTLTLRHAALEGAGRRRCSYWSFPAASWLEDGCEAVMERSTSTTTVCQVSLQHQCNLFFMMRCVAVLPSDKLRYNRARGQCCGHSPGNNNYNSNNYNNHGSDAELELSPILQECFPAHSV